MVWSRGRGREIQHMNIQAERGEMMTSWKFDEGALERQK